MRRLVFVLALSPALAATASATAPRAMIRGPARVVPDGTIVLDARTSEADRPLRWKLDGPDVPFLTLDQDGRKGVVALVPSAPPGVYRFTLIARGVPAGELELDADAAVHVVTVEAPPPPAPPGPAPVPPTPRPTPPGPGPPAGTLHVSLILDLESITPEVARLREAPKARGVFGGLDTFYRTYAATSPDVVRLKLDTVTGRVGLPAVVIQDQTGRVLWSGRAPPDEDGLIALVKGYRGGK